MKLKTLIPATGAHSIRDGLGVRLRWAVYSRRRKAFTGTAFHRRYEGQVWHIAMRRHHVDRLAASSTPGVPTGGLL